MIRISVEQVIAVHLQLIAETGGSDGILDRGLLESALWSPFQSFGREELYPSIQHKAAQMCYALIANHPFIDGNKRIGVHVMLVFLKVNGFDLEYTQEELIFLGLNVAQGSLKAEDIFQWIVEHC